jgi:superfamily I DNA/RNA helicase
VAFNRVIAKQLKRDITAAITGLPASAQPKVVTLHALCLEILGDMGSRLMMPHERAMMIYDVLERHTTVASEYASMPLADQALRDHEAGHAVHGRLWQASVEWLTQHRGELISDLPAKLIDGIRGGDYAEHAYAHVIVDEFQDLTTTEQRLVGALRGGTGTLLALGDPRQSIYAFRGNDREGLAKLEQLTGVSGVIDLPMVECRRCPAGIVRAANTLMSLSDATAMVPTSDVDADVHVVNWTTPEAEAKGMARAVADAIAAYPTSHHLAMVTRRKFGYRLRTELFALNARLKIEMSFSESILELWPVREAFLFFSLLTDPDPMSWRAWLGYANSESGKGFMAAKRNSPAYLQLVGKGVADTAMVRNLAGESRNRRRGAQGAALWDRARRYVDLLDGHNWEDLSAADLIDVAFDERFWVSARCEDAETAVADLRLLQSKARETLFESRQANDVERRGRELKRVARDMRYRIATREPFDTADEPDLLITTLWGAKGLTADYVYVLGLCNEALPGARPEDYPDSALEYADEQRRLFFVSITRPKRALVLSRPQKVKWGDAKRLNLAVSKPADKYRARLTMSEFLRDIMSELPPGQAGAQWAGVARAAE